MIAVCAAYSLFGPAVIVVNNHIIKGLGFPYPMTLSAIGLCTTATFCAVAIRVHPQLATPASQLPLSTLGDPPGAAVGGAYDAVSRSHNGGESPGTGRLIPSRLQRSNSSCSATEESEMQPRCSREMRPRCSRDAAERCGRDAAEAVRTAAARRRRTPFRNAFLVCGLQDSCHDEEEEAEVRYQAARGRWRPSYRFWLRSMVPIGVAQAVTFACGNAAYMCLLPPTFTRRPPDDAL